MRLKDVQLSDPLGPSCASVAVLLPGQNSTCQAQMLVIQADFDAQEDDSTATSDLALAVTATGSGNVTTPVLSISSPATNFSGLRLSINRSLVVTASLSKDTVTSTRA